MTHNISRSTILDPSQMDRKHYFTKGLKIQLSKYSIAFDHRFNKGQLFELLRFHSVVNFDRKIILDPTTLLMKDLSIDLVKALLLKYEVIFVVTSFAELFEQLKLFCVENFKAEDYPRSLYINPFGLCAQNYPTTTLLRAELDMRNISYDRKDTTAVLFGNLEAWVHDGALNPVHNLAPPTYTITVGPGLGATLGAAVPDPAEDAVRIAENLRMMAAAQAASVTTTTAPAASTQSSSSMLADASQLQAEVNQLTRQNDVLRLQLKQQAETLARASDASSKRQRTQDADDVSVTSGGTPPAPVLRFSFIDNSDTPPGPHSPGQTPLIDFSFDALFSKSAEHTVPIQSAYRVSRHLVPTVARDLRLYSVVFLLVKSEGLPHFLLYETTQVSTSYVKLTCISVDPTIPREKLPPATGKVKLGCVMLALSAKSIEDMKKIFAANAANGHSCTWPTTLKPATPAGSHTRQVSFQEQLDDVAFIGDTRFPSISPGDFFPKPAALPPPVTSSSSSSVCSSSSSSSSSSSAASTDLGDALRTLASAAPSGPRTIRKVLGDTERVSVLTADPSQLLAQGNDTLFLSLSYCNPSTANATAIFWGVSRFATQLQPAHLLMMYTHIPSVDIRLFADIWDDFGDRFCIELQNRNKSFISEVNIDKPFNYSIIGHSVPQFRKLLCNFCLTIDLMFMLHGSIRPELHAMLQRVMYHLATLDLDPVDPATPLLLLYWAHAFQAHVSRFYDQVKIKQLKNPGAVVSYLAEFPTGLPSLTTDENTIRLLKQLPSGFPLTLTSAQPLRPPTFHSGATPTPATSASTTSKQGICMYFVCEQTSKLYCRRGEQACGFHHRGPIGATEKAQVKAWFDTHKHMKLQSKYK